MYKLPLLSAAIALTAVLSACGASTPPPDAPAVSAASQSAPESPSYRTISADEAKKMMDEGGVTIVDVRTAEEYAEKHVKDAVNIPVESISAERPEALPDSAATILVYCRSGARSARASKALAELGYENVYNFGGINDWPYETE